VVSIQLHGSGDGQLRFGRRLGPDVFLTIEPGIGRTAHRARMQYRLANWLELRLEAGDLSQRVEMFAALPLR
jgi:autotransporter translocation and assembly factor TamB